MGRKWWLVLAGALGLSSYVYALPYIAAGDLRDAVKAKDADAIEEMVDYTAVRGSLKEQFNAAMMAKMQEDKGLQGNPFAGLGMVLATAMTDRMVDLMVTPAGMRNMMVGKDPKKAGKYETSDAQFDERFEQVSMGYDSSSKFTVRVPMENKRTGQKTELKLVLKRDGLTWLLSDIVIPFNKI